MNKPKRVQRKRSKGFKLPENTKCVNRGTKWGNPFKLTPDGHILYYKTGKLIGSPWCYLNDLDKYTIETVVDLYKDWVTGNFEYKDIEKVLPPVPDPSELKGKNLACFCPEGSSCHGDVLLKLANPEID